MKFEIEILSPVHIGNGTVRMQNEFCLKNGRLYHIDVAEFGNRLNDDFKQKMDEEWWERVCEGKCPDMTGFVEKNNLDLNWQGVETNSRAQNKIMTLIRESKDKKTKKAEVSPFIKSFNQPIIPGSEIKGAIRTAVLYSMLQSNVKNLEALKKNLAIKNNLKILLETYRGLKNKQKKLGAELGRMKRNGQKNSIQYKTQHDKYSDLKKTDVLPAKKTWENEKERVSKEISEIIFTFEQKLFHVGGCSDVKTSLFKNLIVSDSLSFGLEKLIIAEEKITHKEPKTEGNLHTFIKEYLRKDTKGSMRIKTFPDRSEILFQDKDKSAELNIEAIIKACNRFALSKIDSELAYFEGKDFRNRNEYNAVRQFYKGLKIKINKNNENLYLRLGAGQGILSITIDLLLKGADVYKDLIASLKENRANINDDYPASRRIVNIDGGLPPGWIALKEIKS